MKAFKVKIIDQDWKVSLSGDRAFIKEHGDCAAVTITNNHEINLRESDTTFNTILHETVHAYYSMLDTESSNPSPSQTEENLCSLMGRRWRPILHTAFLIFTRVNKSRTTLSKADKALDILGGLINSLEESEE